MEKYGERLKAARKMRGLTQTELATRLGITQKSYQRMETGTHDLKMSTVKQLCQTLEISSDWLLGMEGATVVPNFAKMREAGIVIPKDMMNLPRETVKVGEEKKAAIKVEIADPLSIPNAKEKK